MVYFIATVILLGVLIFVHELGHFIVARYFRVRVEVFSLGFGPKILKKKIGHTEYCLSAIPLGGYVKMFGDELGKEIPREQQKYGYLSQPIPKKSAIAFAGPAFNLGFTILVFALLVFIGRERLSSHLGTIFPDTAAYKAGLRTGDLLATLNGEPVRFGDDAQKKIESLTTQTVELAFLRKLDSGILQPLSFSIPLVQRYGHNEFGQVKPVASIEGFDFMLHAPQIEVVGKNSWAQQVGLQDKDLIVKIEDHALSSLDQILPTLLAVFKKQSTFTLQVARAPQPDDLSCLSEPSPCPTLTLTASSPAGLVTTLRQLGLAPTELAIGKVKPYSAAEKSDLRAHDVLLEAGGQTLNNFEQFRQLIQVYGKEQKSLPLLIDREGTPLTLSVIPEPLTEKDTEQPWVALNYPYAIGIYPFVSMTAHTINYRESNPLIALSVGLSQTWDWSIRFALGIWKLITGQISAKMLSGPIYIGKMAGDMIQAGTEQFLFLMAIISLNLGLINLLPIPVLDGGHLFFFAFEAIFRRKPSIKVMERAFQIGLAFIILLSLFAIYNDLLRVLN